MSGLIKKFREKDEYIVQLEEELEKANDLKKAAETFNDRAWRVVEEERGTHKKEKEAWQDKYSALYEKYLNLLEKYLNLLERYEKALETLHQPQAKLTPTGSTTKSTTTKGGEGDG